MSETTTPLVFSKPAILRLARKAGVKSLCEDTYALIDNMISQRVRELTYDSIAVLNVRGAKTLFSSDIAEALKVRGEIRASGDQLPFNKADVV